MSAKKSVVAQPEVMYLKKQRSYMSGTERVLLQKLILKYEHIIEKRGTDSTSICQKNAAWSSLAKEFNATSESYDLSVKQLKKSWENMKFRIRKERQVTGEMGPLIPADIENALCIPEAPSKTETSQESTASDEEDPLLVPTGSPVTSKRETTYSNDSLLECVIETKLQRVRALVEQEKGLHDLRMKHEREIHELNKIKLNLEIDILRKRINSG